MGVRFCRAFNRINLTMLDKAPSLARMSSKKQ